MSRTLYRRSDIQVCQGHFTWLACCDGEEPLCEGHGAISYCDGSCAGALDRYLDMLAAYAVERPEASTDAITLDVHGDSQSYRVVFEGSDAQAWALAYRAARSRTHHFSEAGDAPFSHAAFPAFADALYPTCEHGMSAELCMGPDHFMSYDQERALYG
jgi:hypothetical protein